MQSSSEKVAQLNEQTPHGAKVSYGDLHLEINYVWLRDHCRCSQCYNESTFQKLVDTLSIPLDIEPAKLTCDEDGLRATWPDGHMTQLPWQWLVENGPGTKPRKDPACLQRILWDGETIKNALPADIPLKEFLETEASLKEAVERFFKWGIVFINGCHQSQDEIVKVANRFSRLQETFYGAVCIVAGDNIIADLAYSTSALCEHTDATYFHLPHGGLIFSCFEHNGEGAMSNMIDGFKAVDKLKQSNPEHYDALCTIPLVMHYRDDQHSIQAYATTITNDPITGEIQLIRYNNNDRAPISHLSTTDIQRFYAANKAFGTILRDPACQFVFKLNPGRIMLFDNWRVLHGRSAFSGRRVLATAYLQREEIDSKIRTMLGVGE